MKKPIFNPLLKKDVLYTFENFMNARKEALKGLESIIEIYPDPPKQPQADPIRDR